ncbi:MAG TPA: hypothetical protein VNM47_05475 [Terriglobia bacterium]|nr:hypothetical protein [Terriglobia bacterium]
MLIIHKGKALAGLLLGVSFFVVLALIFAPVFKGYSGLELSDRLFNRLAKGSSYFVPELSSQLAEFDGQEVTVSVKMGSAERSAQAKRILSKAAPGTAAEGAVLMVKGNLGKLLGDALQDCKAMYLNHGDELKEKYGMDARESILIWHDVLNGTASVLQRGEDRNIAQSKMILAVVTKGLEPAYNFYGIEPESVSHRAGITAFLLIFYLAYTLWWGFGIYFLFEGCGLAMTKARIKREI